MALARAAAGHRRWVGWAAVAFPFAVLIAAPVAEPRWAYMWLLAFSIYVACKAITWSAAPIAGVSVARQLAYLVAWPGLNPTRFFQSEALSARERPSGREWLGAVFRMLAGGVLFWSAPMWIGSKAPIALGWAGMVGVVLMLHFGLFHLLSCFWRANGVDARPLMNRPASSTSVTEFWSERWNTAFRDFTHHFVFRPLTRRWGLLPALILGFFFSGLVHDIVISVSAGGGYGGPTLFFVIQGLAILLEKSHAGRMLGLRRGLRGWLFTAAVLLLPVRLLFHDPFVERVVVPFMQALGAA